MITATTLATFPACPTFGFTSRPVYLTKHTQMDGGHEQSDSKWEEPLHVYEGVPLGEKPQADIEAVMNFWHAMRGDFRRFRFKDWADFKSCSLDDEPAPTDQPITATVGSPGGYQLYKLYEAEGYSTYRKITLPKGDTIRVANELGVEQDSTRWTIDEDTGLLIPGGTFSGVPTTWGGEFYVRVRFDGPVQAEISNHKIQTCTVTLIERRRVVT